MEWARARHQEVKDDQGNQEVSGPGEAGGGNGALQLRGSCKGASSMEQKDKGAMVTLLLSPGLSMSPEWKWLAHLQ